MQETLSEDHMLYTSSNKASSNWDHLLTLQTDLFLPHECSLLYGCYDWLNSIKILDVGCGNGYFTKKLSEQFPDKNITGIDISHELIEIAQLENNSSQISYEQADFLNFQSENSYEVIVMRLIVQHLHDFTEILEKANKLLIPGGTLIILDADHNTMFNHPTLPKFHQLLDHLNSLSDQNNTNRSKTFQLHDIALKTNQWHLGEESFVKIPFINAGQNEKLIKIYNLWLDILENSHGVSDNVQAIRKEITKWTREPNTFAQLGLHFLHLIKNDENRFAMNSIATN